MPTPLFNLLRAFAQQAPEVNPSYDQADYDDSFGAVDANGNPVQDNRYKKASLWTKMFAPDVSSQIGNAETQWQMNPALARQANDVQQGIGASNIARYRPYVGKSFADTPDSALSAMTGGDARTAIVNPSIESGGELANNTPLVRASESLGSASSGDRFNNAFLANSGPENKAGSTIAGDKFTGSLFNEGTDLNLAHYRTLDEIEQAKLGAAHAAGVRGMLPSILGAQRIGADADIVKNARELNNASALDSIMKDTLSTQATQAGVRKALNPVIGNITANQLYNENLAGSQIQPSANPVIGRWNSDGTASTHQRNPLFVSSMENMKYMTDPGPTLSNQIKLPGGVPLPGSTGVIDNNGDPVKRNIPGTSDYHGVAIEQASDFNKILNREFPNPVTRAAKTHEAMREMAKEIVKHSELEDDPRFDPHKLGSVLPEEAIYEALTTGHSHGFTKGQVLNMFQMIPHDERADIYKKILTKIDAVHKDGRNAVATPTHGPIGDFPLRNFFQ